MSAFGRLDYQANARNHVSAAFDFMNYRAPNAYSASPSYNNSSLDHQRKLHLPRAHLCGELGFHHLQLRRQQSALPMGPRPGSRRFQRGRALREPLRPDDLRRELRSAAHRRTGRAPHPDLGHVLQSPRPPYVQDRRRCELHPRTHDQPVQRHRPVQLQRNGAAGHFQQLGGGRFRNQHRRRSDRQALQHLHAGQRPHHARRQGRFL